MFSAPSNPTPSPATHAPWGAITVLLASCLLLMVLDQATGPYIRVSLVFVVPVALAAYRWNWMVGITVGVLLASSRVWLVLRSSAPWLVLPELANLGMSLVLFAVVSVVAQRRGLRSSRPDGSPVLAVCGGCGRVRDVRHGGWRRFERLVSTVTTARFDHTVCPECEAHSGSAPASPPGPSR